MTNKTLTASAATRTAMQTPAAALYPESAGNRSPAGGRLAPDPPVGWLHLDVPCRRTLSLVWRTDAYRPAAARALTEFAAGYFRTWRGEG